jgi:hypothetical protein
VSLNLADLTDAQLLRHWQQKALVCVCRDPTAHRQETVSRGGSPYLCGGSEGDWCGPQREAKRTFREILRRQVPPPPGWYVALLEDNSCGRRRFGSPAEFDAVLNAHIACLESARGT